MTRSDEVDIRLLERDLQRLAKPRPDDDAFQAALRAQLDATARPAPRRRVRRRFVLRFTPIAAAAAVIAALVVVGTTGSAGPDVARAAIIRDALRTITPPANEILHVEVVGIQNGTPVMGETWQQTSAPYASRGLKGEVGHQAEFGDNGTSSLQYSPESNTITERRDSTRPTFADPVSQIRNELAAGRAQDVGTVVINGTPLYKIDLPHGLVAYFDQNAFRPRYLDDPQSDGHVLRLRVVAYHYLPMTPPNRALLSVTAQHPTARIESAPGAGTHK